MTQKDVIVRLTDISVQFDDFIALQHISLELYQGELVSLIGPNGAGKSTLVKVILGIQSIQLGERWVKPNLKQAYVPQKLILPPEIPLRVQDLFSLELPTKQVFEQTLQLVGCEDLLLKSVHHLSGGQLQRVSLARALLRTPQLLVLDEPTQGLDPDAELNINQLLGQLPKLFNMSVIVISHDLNWVQAGTERVICLNKHICCQGSPESIQNHQAFLDLYGMKRSFYHHHHDNCQHHHFPLK